jgi:hypothetical protein
MPPLTQELGIIGDRAMYIHKPFAGHKPASHKQVNDLLDEIVAKFEKNRSDEMYSQAHFDSRTSEMIWNEDRDYNNYGSASPSIGDMNFNGRMDVWQAAEPNY